MELREFIENLDTYRNRLIVTARKILATNGIEQTDENISRVCEALHADIYERIKNSTEDYFLMGASEHDPKFIQGFNPKPDPSNS